MPGPTLPRLFRRTAAGVRPQRAREVPPRPAPRRRQWHRRGVNAKGGGVIHSALSFRLAQCACSPDLVPWDPPFFCCVMSSSKFMAVWDGPAFRPWRSRPRATASSRCTFHVHASRVRFPPRATFAATVCVPCGTTRSRFSTTLSCPRFIAMNSNTFSFTVLE